MPTFNHVTASVAGREITLRLRRDHLHAFEVHIEGSAYKTLRSFLEGTWRVGDLHAVLEFAASDRSQDLEHMRQTMQTQPPADYAVLAQQVLSAALFGVCAEEAVFSDQFDATTALAS